MRVIPRRSSVEGLAKYVWYVAIAGSVSFPASWGLPLWMSVPLAVGVAVVLALVGKGVMRLWDRRQLAQDCDNVTAINGRAS